MTDKPKYFTKEEIDELKQIFEVRRIEPPTYTPGEPQQFSIHKPVILTKPPTCPKCGITLEKVMMYSCPNESCPTGLGSIAC